MAPATRRGPNTTPNNTNLNNMTPESVQAMIDQALLRNSTNGDGSHSSHEDNRRNVQTARPCFYADFMKCQPLNFKGTEDVVGLTRWIEKMESVFNISGCVIENQVKFVTCTLLGVALTWWNGQIRTLGPDACLNYGLKEGKLKMEELPRTYTGLSLISQSLSILGLQSLAELHERDTQDLYALLEDAQDGRTRISQRVAMDSQRVDLLMGDRMTLQETIWIMEEEAYASREAWAHF
ncbi:hypothetical protein Tco_1090921 [Tanacetum coccineum]|uniref:Retrotransposon gag domain-containing protein n=1 Tax=Tanacetum coccineum TaxID=301880 RepID=A0ABQ5I5K9_9ASTR